MNESRSWTIPAFRRSPGQRAGPLRISGDDIADHVVFGSDYPMANAQKIDYWYAKLGEYFDGKPGALENLLKRNVRPLMERAVAREEA